jgi:WD40 repeat protein
MPPPQKRAADGQVDFHAVHAPLNTPLSFVSKSVVCCVHGNSVCLWDTDDGSRQYLHTTAHSITKISGNAAAGLLAFCEGGTSPQVFVYSVPVGGVPKLLFTLADTTELELADLAFSRDGSRLYALSKATSKRLSIFSAKTGAKLNGCQLDLPLRFDKVAVYPGHKDYLALVRTSSVRIVTIQKSFETYICKLHPSAIPTDIDISISAYAWTNTGHFLFATRQGLLAVLDGTNGQLLHVCHTEQPITSIAMTTDHVATAHIGNSLRFWCYDPNQLPGASEAEAQRQAGGGGLPSAVPIEQSTVFNLEKVADLEGFDQMQQPDEMVYGQVAYLQPLPEMDEAILTTAEGEVWMLQPPASGRVEDADEEGVLPDMTLTPKNLQMRLLTWFHTHPISDVAFLGPSQLCASADEGGRLRIWPIRRNPETKGFAVIRFTSALTSLAADEQDGKILLAGSDSGVLHCVDCSGFPQAQVADSVRMSEAGVAKVCCTRYEESLCVAAALFNHKIAFLSVAVDECKVSMLGFVDVAGMVDDICFHTQGGGGEAPKLLAVGSSTEGSFSSLWAIRAPPNGYDPKTPDLKKETCPVWSLKLSSGSKLAEKATAVASATKKTVVIGFASGGLRVYTVPSTLGLPSAKQATAHVLEELAPHGQLITCVRITRNGAWLITASMDGTVRRSPVDKGGGKEMQKLLHNPYNGGALQVCANDNASILLSTGGSDGVMVWSEPGSKAAIPPAPEAVEMDVGQEQAVNDIDDLDINAFPLWAPTSEEQRAAALTSLADVQANANPEVNAVASAHRKALTLEVEGLRKKVRMLVDDNAQCPDLEKLDRGEFCVDFEERDAIAAKTKERCDVLRAQIENENLARQLIRDRLVKEFWDPMRTRGCQIVSLVPGSTLAVSNYPERIVSDEEKGIQRKLKNLRQVEMLEDQMLDSQDCPAPLRRDKLLRPDPFTTKKEKYIVNWWPAVSLDDNTKDVNIANTQLLYEPFELLTNSRRRLQIHLLQSHAAEYRAKFNEVFKKCQDDKQGIMDQMKERIARIRGILGELQIDEKTKEPELHDLEEAEAVLKVRDKEIAVDKWISQEERQKMEEDRLKEEERQRQLRENDAGQRALAQMMGGTLKTKKDLSALEITLDREPWMDQIPVDDMTDLQKQALKEFEEKEKALAEEQEKYRKQLHAELATLRSQLEELVQQFDEEHLKKLHQQRFIHDAKAFCQELYCVRLQLALLQSVEDQNVLEQSIKDVEEADIRLTEAETRLDAFKAKVSEAKEKQENLVQYERNVSSVHYFKQQFTTSNLEPELVNSLLHMFRKKAAAKAAAAAPRHSEASPEPGSPGDQALRKSITRRQTMGISQTTIASSSPTSIPGFDPTHVADPYADLGTQGADASPSGATPSHEEDLEDKCPDGVDEANFHRMLDLRRDRMRAEVEVQKGRAVLDEMGGLLAHYQRERDEAKNACEQIKAELEDHKELMNRELYDIEILFKLKQGQVEVPQAAVVTDYSDAVVIGNQVVESRNQRILELGKDKVGTLETTKEFRKKLNLIHWEHKMLAAKTSDLEERTKDVHMLRVTKDLQRLLKGGEESRNKAETEMLEKKIEHLNSTTAKKEQALRRQYAMNNHSAKLRKGENAMLEKKLRELQQNVIQREHIRRLRAPQGGGAAAGGETGQKPRIVGGGGRIEENEAVIRTAQTTFREVKGRQGLMDAARKHTEEIEVLRKELDRLRQKTFPSFVQLHEDRPANPDHV